MKKQIFRALCLTLFAGLAFASCDKEENNNGKYTVTVNSADESMGKAYGGGQFDAGTTTRIWGTPEVGYQFDRWNDGNTENPRNITVNGDVTYTAYFKTIGGDNPGTDTTGGGDNPGNFVASFTVDGSTYSGIALISYGGDGTGLYDLQIITGEGADTDPRFGVWIRPQTGTQGINQGASCYYMENIDDVVNTANGEFPHYQTISNCNYSINVTAFDLNSQMVSLTASGELFDIQRAENGEGAHKVNFSVSIDGYWQYPSTPSDK